MYQNDQNSGGTPTIFLTFYSASRSNDYYRESAIRQMIAGICYELNKIEYSKKREALRTQLDAIKRFYKSKSAATSIRQAYQSFCEIRDNVDTLLADIKDFDKKALAAVKDTTVLKLLDQVCAISKPLQLKQMSEEDKDDLRIRVNAFLKDLKGPSGQSVDSTSKRRFWCERPKSGGGMYVAPSHAYDPKLARFINDLPKSRYEKYDKTSIMDQLRAWRTLADGTFCQVNKLRLSGGSQRSLPRRSPRRSRKSPGARRLRR
jgi:hypothetical protein